MTKQVIRVLIIEDDREDYMLAKHYLKEIDPDKYEVAWGSAYEKAMQVIANQTHDVYLVDYNLGNNNGVDLVRQATNSGILKPFIFLTGMDDLSVDEKALEAGAVDFLIKHKINKEILERSIRYAMHQKMIEKELQESNNTKNKLFSIISHDLRSPLTSLAGSLEVLAADDSDLDKAIRNRILDELNRTTKTTLTLLDNLLNWSRSQIGAIALNREWIALGEIVNQVFDILENNRRQKNLELINQVDKDVEIFADRNALTLIIRNLCSNAVKFTPEQGTIKVSAVASGKTTTVYVEDNGIGMNEVIIKKVLEDKSFYSTFGTANEKGSGLGLIITREFIEKQGGLLSVESTPGKGSRFSFSLSNP